MSFEPPFFQINYKLYPDTWGEDGLEFAKTAARVADEFGVDFVLSPQTADIRLVARETDLPILAQGMSPHEPGRGLGHILAESLREAGATGVMMNHPERRETAPELETKIRRCREVGLTSVVCVENYEFGKAVLEWDPDWVVFEQPELLGTTTSLNETDPEAVERFSELVAERNPRTNVFLGGGISSVADVEAALELADATGSASWISSDVPVEEREETLRAIAEVLAEA
ncbi:triosephosphate isomerase [Halopelagius inordinatus]|uniref:Triosephosphate isomerase n=1 Tax=Halopelagius inordinatus TaxID=553467 RepID=A0A1I2SS67_9EURY|nr:triose-phosphate isomerase [Halopelagius inordinatus]SFG55675.1 triosephosphate isomerase [Halopelagius inordinatus]